MGGNARDAAPAADAPADPAADSGTPPSAPDATVAEPGVDARVTPPSSRLNFFISGHSLTDDPLGENVRALAASLGMASEYNEQIILGSPVRVRTRGMNAGASGWDGYRTGKNRGGAQNLDVIGELRSHATISGPYDALLITERHDIINVLIWEETVRYVRNFHDRLIAGNEAAHTHLYHSWLPVNDLDDPSGWIAYERGAQVAWECIGERINLSLNAEGRPSRVFIVPAGYALTVLVERAVQGMVPGLDSGSTRQRVTRLFTDGVHLTPLGVYYMSLVSFASMAGRSPEGGAVPAGIDAGTARALQQLAWSVVSGYRQPSRGMSACNAQLRSALCQAFGRYNNAANAVQPCQQLFTDGNRTNPFNFDAATDRGYWFE